MPRTLPQVENDRLLPFGGRTTSLEVGSPQWLEWLDAPDTRSFAFSGADGSITVRKDRRERGGSYWVAYRKARGKLRNFYIGKSADVTVQRLNEAASTLTAEPAPAGTGVEAAASGPSSNLATQEDAARRAGPAGRGQQAAHRALGRPASVAHSAPPGPLDTLLRTKLHIPPPTPTVVHRPRLLQRLETLSGYPLTVIVAPAGYGKTTLLKDWIYGNRAPAEKSSPPINVAWLGLDEQDNDPTRFWLYVIAALRTAHPSIGEDMLYVLRSGSAPSDTVLSMLANQLSEGYARADANAPGALPRPHIVLVLDDYHLIESKEIHQSVVSLLNALPPNVHLVMTSRHDPPLPLPRLRARGQLLELRASDLRFTAQESAEFLSECMGLQLTAADIEALERRTEGWIAGLQMAAISMQDRADPGDRSAFIQGLSGSHRFVLDYLVEEVLRDQTPEVQRFLLWTSILDRLCAPLCDSLLAVAAGEAGTGADNPAIEQRGARSQRMLEMLEDANLFLTPLDDERHWYRYHHLFADVLRVRLREAWPALAPVLHRSAARWYEEQRQGTADVPALESELEHLVAAGTHADIDRAADVIEQEGDAIWSHGESRTLLRWIDRLPRDLVLSRPWLAVLYALFLQGESRGSSVPPLLEAAERALTAGEAHDTVEARRVRGWIATIRSHFVRNREDYEQAINLAEEALQLLPESDRRGRAGAYWALALSRHMRGDLESSLESYSATQALTDPWSDPYLEGITRCLQADVLFDMGRLGEVGEPIRPLAARASARFSAQGAASTGRPRAEWEAPVPPVAGWALVELGRVALARNELGLATDLLEKGVALARRGAVRDAICMGYSSLLPLYIARGELEKARAVDMEFTALAEETRYAFYIDWAAAVGVRLRLAEGDMQAAAEWAALYTPRPQAHFYSHRLAYAAFVRVLMSEGRHEEALEKIDKQLPYTQAHGHVITTVELLVLQAICHKAVGSDSTALRTLDAALSMAAPQAVSRIFLDEGRPAAALISEWAAQAVQARISATDAVYGFVLRVFGAFPEEQRAGLQAPAPLRKAEEKTAPSNAIQTEPLTQREEEILHLIAEGLSTQEMAVRLTVTAGTVKTHLHHLYGKLDARDRTQALVRAREFGLLS